MSTKLQILFDFTLLALGDYLNLRPMLQENGVILNKMMAKKIFYLNKKIE